MTTAVRDRQRAFQETEVHDQVLVAMAGEYYEARELAREPAKRFRKAKKELKEAIEANGLVERMLNERVRFGEYIVTGTPSEGGPTNIPEWKSWRPKVEKVE